MTSAVDDTIKTFKLGKLKSRSEFLFVRDGLYRARKHIVIQMRRNAAHNHIRVGFTATKRVGNAVIRNKAKRRMREAARAVLPEFGIAAHDYVFIARKDTADCLYQDLLDDTKKALITLAKQKRASI